MKLPIKTRVIQYAIEKDAPFTAKEVYRAIREEYPGEAGCSVKAIDDILLVVKGNGYLDYKKVGYDENGELSVEYEVTQYGKDCEKYTR